MANQSSAPEWNADSPFNPQSENTNDPHSMPDDDGVDGVDGVDGPSESDGVVAADESQAAVTETAAGSSSGQELLRRLSTISPGNGVELLPHMNPDASYPGLELSGRVISAVFCVPHTITYRKDSEWELDPRRGTSALFNALGYLSSDETAWDHTIVGWTGEIKSIQPQSLPHAKDLNELTGDSTQTPIQPTKTHSRNNHERLMITREERRRLEKLLEEDPGGRTIPVWLVDDLDSRSDVATFENQARWRRFGEHELYTLFHYRQHEPTDGRKERLWWADYSRMNNIFADRIMEVYQPGDVIWIHDYHLMLLPSILRQRLPDAHIGFFLHIPFPSSEYVRCQSRRKEVLQGVLGANLVGFQSFGYSRHFISCCKRILRFDSSPAGIDAYGARVAVDVFPIGIHTDATRRAAYEDDAVLQKIKSIRELYAGKKIIVGRDRLDSVRGVAQKLQAFELFLESYPEWHDKVVLIQVTSPTSVEEEREDSSNKTANKIADLVSRINGNHGSVSFSPVQHFSQYIAKEEYFALLRVADVGLITSVRDGMNTTSLEYVVCQEGSHGPLILSEFSGTAGNLSAALHINPWDLSGVAKMIDRALKMSEEERVNQHQRLYKHVTKHTVQQWTNKYLHRLLTTISSFGQSVATPLLDKAQLLAQFRKADKRLFMFDYDGTLTPIVQDPQSAIPSDRVIRTLKTLAADTKNTVWIISGRDQAFLDEWMGHIPELGLSAEHGSFVRYPMEDTWENVTEKTDMSWQNDVMEVFQHYTEKTQGSFIERKKVALTWHYRNADPEYGLFQARECTRHLETTIVKKADVEVLNGKANVEVRPKFVNKGEIAKRLIRSESDEVQEGHDRDEIHVKAGPDFVFCLGDDFTDEDMFKALNASDLAKEGVFACTVGASSKQTLATWHLLEPRDVISTIGMLNGSTDDGSAGAVAILDGEVEEWKSMA